MGLAVTQLTKDHVPHLKLANPDWAETNAAISAALRDATRGISLHSLLQQSFRRHNLRWDQREALHAICFLQSDAHQRGDSPAITQVQVQDALEPNICKVVKRMYLQSINILVQRGLVNRDANGNLRASSKSELFYEWGLLDGDTTKTLEELKSVSESVRFNPINCGNYALVELKPANRGNVKMRFSFDSNHSIRLGGSHCVQDKIGPIGTSIRWAKRSKT